LATIKKKPTWDQRHPKRNTTKKKTGDGKGGSNQQKGGVGTCAPVAKGGKMRG